ncbi:T9SS type B sorting domain-containing protein [Urechidicola croceus]|uniref:Ig-like domain-containing protein n=1 Tax=Urechidicola croceus TaxID=1850246 RepID=A0A1D8PAN5_9FLAO|nr:T9SS type B sorting domain-containing protein [Urechidicola croceus]AOW21648.1 hypothetical protein LPB138_13585 [Urechidicola croceus]
MIKKIHIIFTFLVFSIVCHSQGPNDCISATSICGDVDFVYTPTSPGANDFLTNPNPTCLPNSPVESQSVWLELEIDTGGTLEFLLAPNNGTDDYDWAVYDLSISSCSNLLTPIRCSSTMFLAGTGGATGLGNGATDFNEGPGTGDAFLAPIDANDGDTYLLFINNWSGTTSGFDLVFNGSATFNPPPEDSIPTGLSVDLEECDLDGTLDNSTAFDLTVNTPIILGSQSGLSVTYYETEELALIGEGEITNATAYPNISDPQTVYARLTNNTTECFSLIDFEISIGESLPVTVPNIDQCDDDNDGVFDFDLTEQDDIITGGQTDLIVSYFNSETAALNGGSPITGIYTNSSNPETLWARVDNTAGGCFGIDSFQIFVSNTPIAAVPDNMSLCDDDNNGTMPFILTDQDDLINSDITSIISYHDSPEDADTGADPLAIPYETASATIYARVENTFNTDCYSVVQFGVEVYQSPMPLDESDILPLELCDNDSVGDDTDGFIEFDLTQNETQILNGQSDTDFSLTYFIDSDYLNQIPISLVENYPNESNPQTIFVRMTNNLDDSCFADTSFEIEVFELPILSSGPYVLEQCDDDFDGFNTFNLTEINGDIIETITTEVFTYYESETEAEIGTPSITNFTEYINEIVNIDTTLWVRIENESECFRIVQVELVVKPSEIPDSIDETFYACDDGDTLSESTDGIATFNFESMTQQIRDLFPLDVVVFYYENELDAISEQNEILDPSNHRNTNSPGTQEIWVRADSELGNDCLGYGQHLTLIVEPLPEFDVIDVPVYLCLNEGSLELETFNASNTYSYEWMDESGTVVGTDENLIVTSGGVYSVTATFNGVNSGDTCVSLPKFVEVIESSPAVVTFENLTVTDNSENNTIAIDIVNLGVGDYEFSLGDTPYQDEPFFENIAPGIHILTINDKNGCGETSIEVSVLGFPKFFTPNNDGQNDTWQVKGVTSSFFSSSLIHIYDRFGKVIAIIDHNDEGWNGYYNGNQLPSTDYWFTADLVDLEGNIRSTKGHFSLIRR